MVYTQGLSLISEIDWTYEPVHCSCSLSWCFCGEQQFQPLSEALCFERLLYLKLTPDLMLNSYIRSITKGSKFNLKIIILRLNFANCSIQNNFSCGLDILRVETNYKNLNLHKICKINKHFLVMSFGCYHFKNAHCSQDL